MELLTKKKTCTIHHRKIYFYHYCLQAFSTEEILKCCIKGCFKINGKKRSLCLKKGEYVKFKNYERKIKSPFIIYADFENILVPEGNGKQNPKESYTNKYQKHIACSYGNKLVCVDGQFSNPFKTYSGKDEVYNFINNMIEESKYCSGVMKKYFNKELSMKTMKILRTLLNVESAAMIMLIIMLKYKRSLSYHWKI